MWLCFVVALRLHCFASTLPLLCFVVAFLSIGCCFFMVAVFVFVALGANCCGLFL